MLRAGDGLGPGTRERWARWGVALVLLTAARCGDGGRVQGTDTTTSGVSSSSGDATGGDASVGPGSTAGGTSAGNRPPTIEAPGDLAIAEDEALVQTIAVADPDGDPVRVFLLDLPPGARWLESERRLEFTPDFIQGGQGWQVRIVADDGSARAEATFAIAVEDTIRPPAPTIAESVAGDGFTRLTLSQKTDDYLDSPGFAGRAFDAIVTAPDGASAVDRRPVRVLLHGYDGVPASDGWSGEFRIAPHDPDNTYWWGYAESLPNAAPAGAVREYTARRVLHLIEWVLREYPGADPERVYLDGVSMGGAGALTIGLIHGRHFAWVSALVGQAIPRNHRPSRLATLSGLWGAPELGLDDGAGQAVWDRMDLTRVLRDEPTSREQMLFLKHGKDDTTIHFGAVVIASPRTGSTFYEALQSSAVGHLAVWDEGGHLIADPVLGDGWWQLGWNPIFDATAIARRDLAFPAFTRSSLDRDPGDGTGNGERPWDPETGFAGDVAVPGDTGWTGEIAGALNRALRWDGTAIVDEIDRFEVPLRVLDGDGGAPPLPGYPTTGDRLDGALPVTVDVTLRRTRAFRATAGERLRWQFGAASGEVDADPDGQVTIPALALGAAWTTLVVTRAGG